ncbi:hypothetical protein ABLB69_09445 [Xenorhabdus khoisanae]|uniref:hypothetical protein n=1 Tax=Xenorhabdus khoisanae TaxID=880157 RepID=UPI0032B71EC0
MNISMGFGEVGILSCAGFLLPPLMFSEEEIQALTVGAHWVSKQTAHFLSRHKIPLLIIEAVLPSDLRAVVSDNALDIDQYPEPVEAL